MKNRQYLHFLFICFLLVTPETYADDLQKANKAYEQQEYETAFELYTLLAEQGNVTAQAKLGLMYYWGWGTNPSNSLTYQWSLKAAKQNEPLAQQTMGFLYEEGIFVNQNTRRAAEWYQQSAAQNHYPAMARLANIYYQGKDIPKNLKLALKYAKQAAEANNAFAQYMLGVIYQSDMQNYQKAQQWFLKSIKNGYADAANALGILYNNGLGQAKDRKRAYYWFKIADERGSKEGLTNRLNIRVDLEHEDILRLEQEAHEWLKKNPIEKTAKI
ncbi:tetratricopeptide repeat protein [Aliikangiella maris]|uniref:Tetratricopeptide repeat protein n=2 Tax=Aliikangiella maris TaxID=3162458 RepID=A0ABV2BR95_9GAMM